MAAIANTVDRAEEVLADEALEEERLLEELENEELPGYIREKRMAELKQQVEELHLQKEKDYGLYTDIKKEKEFFDMTLQEKKVLVHFYHQDFRRCSIIDEHLEKLAPKHFSTKFAKISVEVAKFFVDKLKIKVLPALICFKEGKIVDRIVGFEELGNTDSFTTENLERRLAKSGIITLPDVPAGGNSLLGYKKKDDDGYDSSDPDEY
ncbi:uncharacterized protein [Ptychodera flava]|uniref:uncharacterized protein n=1 Tax=Ptychodera flava TaxID=63121 RepID=UPI003969F051